MDEETKQACEVMYKQINEIRQTLQELCYKIGEIKQEERKRNNLFSIFAILICICAFFITYLGK